MEVIQNNENYAPNRIWTADCLSSITKSCIWKGENASYREGCKSRWFVTDTAQSHLLAVTGRRKLLCKMYLRVHL